ncbi:MAG: ATP-dependent metallopeptidase FtsH/Yme1/Tma family protein [Nitrospirae bacterium]|nr:MAG: ATP-dependent metallopeptidase FtsH/Yme1/Tma family protein [Nitrospirota bacterium]
MNPKQKQFSIWYIFIALWALMLFQIFVTPYFNPTEIPYSEFKAAIAAGNVEEVSVSPAVIHGRMKADHAKEGRTFDTIRVEDPNLVRDLEAQHVKVTGVIESTLVRDVLSWVVPIALFAGFWLFLLRRMGQGQGGFMTVGRSKAKVYMEKEVKVSFADVAGVDEAKQELQEVIEFLKTPEKFTRLGGKIPKGILLVGPSGTGKTLLAKAVAGEAGVPFFSTSGSEFVEMFVGVGAARVRDLFLQAKEMAPCIIFIDELDALGKARGVGPMAHEEREQTLNQLLVEMDGFDPRVGVILMAATNRPEILDPALLRAGRFDRHVLVDRPDKIGRLEILKIHARSIPLAAETDLDVIAAMTPGFVGADLANLINEAALLAVRRNKDVVGLSELQEAVERIIAGLEKKNRILNPAEKERVAHHEVGHALMALSIPGADTVQKISIIPRGIAALGYTLQLPTEDRFLMTKSELENKIAVLLGGRVAEEVIYREVSTGAQDDLLKATDIAKSMVKVYGMSDKLGQISFDRDRQPLFLQTGQPQTPGDYSEETSREIDCEIRRIIDEQYARVRTLLHSQQHILREAATVLLGKETITGEELKAIIAQTGARS